MKRLVAIPFLLVLLCNSASARSYAPSFAGNTCLTTKKVYSELTTGFTYSIWLKDIAPNSTSVDGLIMGQGGINTRGAMMMIDKNGQLVVRFRVNVNRNATTSATPIRDGAWHHVAAAWDRSKKTITIYFDGHLQITYTHNDLSKTLSPNNPFSLGSMPDTTGSSVAQSLFARGSFSEVAIWSTPLDAATIAELAKPERLTVKDAKFQTNLLDYWPMIEAAGNTAQSFGGSSGNPLVNVANSGAALTWLFDADAMPFYRYVVPAGTEGNTPTAPYITPETAANSIQVAIDAASAGETVRVAPGTYKLSKPVTILEKKHFTVTSWDPTRDGATNRDATLLDGDNLTRCVEIRPTTNATTDMDSEVAGFTLLHGNANTASNAKYYGGGAYVVGAASSLANAGLRNRLVNCVVTNCTVTKSGGGIQLGSGTSNLADGGFASNCVFYLNTAQHAAGASIGTWRMNGSTEGTHLDEYRLAGIYDCVFSNNTASSGNGGAVGMMDNNNSRLGVVRRSRFANNSSKSGGGHIQMSSYSFVEGCTFSGTGSGSYGTHVNMADYAVLSNCLFTGCKNSTGYGTIHTVNKGTELVDCVLTNNSLGIVCVFVEGNAAILARQCLFANNNSNTFYLDAAGNSKSANKPTGRCEDCTFYMGKNSLTPITYAGTDRGPNGMCVNVNCIFDADKAMTGTSSSRYIVLSNCLTRTAMTSASPYDSKVLKGNAGFLNAATGDYALRQDSICRDYGQVLPWMTGKRSLDLAGKPRLVNAAGVPFASNAKPDLGCYECQAQTRGLLIGVRLE